MSFDTYLRRHLLKLWERAESATMADCCWMMRMFSGVTAAARGTRRRISIVSQWSRER